MANESQWKCPIHSITGEVRTMDSSPTVAIEDIQLVITQGRKAAPSREYYFNHIRPVNNALVAHFLQNPIGYLYSDTFNQDIEVPSDELLKAKGYQDRFDGYQGTMYITLHQAIQYTENNASQMFTPEDLTMWNQFGICSGELFERHNPQQYRNRIAEQQTKHPFGQSTTPQGMLIATGADTMLRYTNIFRNMAELYPWSNNIKSVDAFMKINKTAETVPALLKELMRLPVSQGGSQLLAEVLSGSTMVDKHVDDRFFVYDFDNEKVSLSDYYWQRKSDLVDPSTETTLCPAHYVSFPLRNGGRLSMADMILEDGLHGAQKYLFAPSAGVEFQIQRI